MTTAGNAPLQHGSKSGKRLVRAMATVMLVLLLLVGSTAISGCSTQASNYSDVPVVAGEETSSTQREQTPSEDSQLEAEQNQELTEADRDEIESITRQIWDEYYTNYSVEVIEPAKASGDRATPYGDAYNDKYQPLTVEGFCEPSMVERLQANGNISKARLTPGATSHSSIVGVTVWSSEELATEAEADPFNQMAGNNSALTRFREEVLPSAGFSFDLYAVATIKHSLLSYNADTREEFEPSAPAVDETLIFGKKNGEWYPIPSNNYFLF